MEPKSLIHQYLLGNLRADEVAELDRLLTTDPELRREFRLAVDVDSGLRDLSIERTIQEVHDLAPYSVRTGHTRKAIRWAAMGFVSVAAAALLVVGLRAWRPPTIATIASSEDAGWESTLPTRPGSNLTTGVLNLKTGIATIQFRSGVELVLEAPAQVELVSKMRARLSAGAAVIEVPESAKGFVLETPEGYAIDFGTRFAVSVDEQRQATDFELIEGRKPA